MKSFGFLLNGRFSTAGEQKDIHSPFNGDIVGHVTYAAKSDLESAIVSAQKAFEITRALPSYKRAEVLHSIARQISDRKEEFARMIALEAGKPIRTARAEVDRGIFTFTVAAEEAGRMGGEVLPLDQQSISEGRWAISRRFPVGPVAAITPFNFPLNLVAHKVAPAIAAGCTMVLKPAPQTPMTALMLGEVVQHAGWPDGALNVLPLSNDDATPLVEDDRFKLLTFTGSAPVGWAMKARAGKKKVVLELGGNAGVIIHSDADLEYAAERCVTGGFSYAGQSCISVQRILVEASIFESFQQALMEKTRKLKLGNPLDETTDVGPLIRESDAMRAEAWVKEAVAQGAKLLTGGRRNGTLYEPTILTQTKPEMRVNCQEAFAPVVTLEQYSDFREAIRSVNRSSYGLQAGLFTRDASLIFEAYNELEVGGVVAGDVPTFRMDNMPYGGVKESGLGREGLRWAIEDMTEQKLLVMNLR
ncbi:MAG TPA: aldehyde dehydrogenase family protein [Terriglobales bacterium]|nr:aldehyde dehydrogenase family protein [Terriglobales bacterium]